MGVSAIPPERSLVVWHPVATPPDGYIKANGAALSRSAYAWLFSKIGTAFGAGDGATTFNIPDLRAEFLRGLDDGRGIDSGRVLGSAQSDLIKSHNHEIMTLDWGSPVVVTRVTRSNGTADGAGFMYTQNSGGAETRPRNVAGLFCIAYAP